MVDLAVTFAILVVAFVAVAIAAAAAAAAAVADAVVVAVAAVVAVAVVGVVFVEPMVFRAHDTHETCMIYIFPNDYRDACAATGMPDKQVH